MQLHATLFVLFLASLGFAALYFYAKRKKEDVAAALKGVLDAAWNKGLVLEADLKNKILALEDGGHLAAGTAQALSSATKPTVTGGTNGGQPAPTSTAATT